MNWIPYNPADAFYKSVPGAVETDRPFRLRLILPRAFGATGAHFLLQRDGEAAVDHPMYWAGMDGDDKEIWDIELSVPEKGLYFYHFDYDSSWGRGSVFHSGDGIGALDPIFLQLPNSGILVQFTMMFGLNSDGTSSEEAGTTPDIPSPAGEPALVTALRAIGEAP